MSEQMISLKTVNELRLNSAGEPQRYFIAAYQRGYRWSPLQVTQLLEDIREFTRRRNPQPEEFYCLQPLVLKVSADGGYEVVDGQQRLTTLLLILSYFNERLIEKFRTLLFTLDYETRPSLVDFLKQPTEELAESNVDFFYMYGAVATIENWFSNKENEVEEIKTALLNRTKVIWYQLSQRDNAVEAFTRLNVGKIPLTNDELIRALFLKRLSAEESEAAALQHRIAHEWDQIEKALQSDVFWYFLSNQSGKAQNRIGFLFELVARAEGLPPEVEHDDYGIFFAFSQKLKEVGASPEHEWRKVKQTFLMLEEWFEDRILYHIVGFLVSDEMSIGEISKLSEQSTKSEFEWKLRQKIFNLVIGGQLLADADKDNIREQVEERLEGLEYRLHRKIIKRVLLLFNLATLLQNRRSNLRFQFDSFKNERWNIEHIRSVTSDKPERYSDRVAWLNHCLGYLKSQATKQSLQAEIEAFVALTQQESVAVFDSLYEKVLEFFHEKTDELADHGIANLTLLDEHTNKSYKNAVFAVKRQRLLSLDQAGIFVPLCTRNVFLKCYSPHVDNVMFWGQADRDAYQDVIVNTLVNFFIGKTDETI